MLSESCKFFKFFKGFFGIKKQFNIFIPIKFQYKNKNMRYIFLFLLLFTLNYSYSQKTEVEEPLLSSIACKKGIMGDYFSRILVRADKGSYPADICSSKLMFIEISEDEIYGIKGFVGPNHDKINSKVKASLTKKFGDSFTCFENDARYDFKQTYLDQGFKYRVLVHQKWKKVDSNYKPMFRLLIEDLETGKIYSGGMWYWVNNYIKKFTETCD